MTYFVNYIEPDGSLYALDFSTKKKAQDLPPLPDVDDRQEIFMGNVSFKEAGFILENELENAIWYTWFELYRAELKAYNSVIAELYVLARECVWVERYVPYSLGYWEKSINTKEIIFSLVAKVQAYSGENYKFVEAIYNKWNDEECKNYKEKWGYGYDTIK